MITKPSKPVCLDNIGTLWTFDFNRPSNRTPLFIHSVRNNNHPFCFIFNQLFITIWLQVDIA